MYTPSEVSNLNRAIGIEQVFWLYVSVDYALCVHVFQGLQDLSNVIGRSRFVVSTLWLRFQVVEQFTTWREFENQVDLLVICEEPVHPEDVLVAQMALDLNLPPELNLHIVLDELTLVQNLERHDEL